MTEPQITYDAPIIVDRRPPSGLRFMTFTSDTDINHAVSKFVKQYGCMPASVIRDRGNLYVGPIGE